MSSTNESLTVVVTFPPHLNLQQIAQQMSEDHPFLENIQKIEHNILKIDLDNIADLLDLDFSDSYGASHIKIHHSNS